MTYWLTLSVRTALGLAIATALSLLAGWLGMGWWAALPLLAGIFGFHYIFRKAPGAWLRYPATIMAVAACTHAAFPEIDADAEVTTSWFKLIATFKNSVSFDQLVSASFGFAILELIRHNAPELIGVFGIWVTGGTQTPDRNIASETSQPLDGYPKGIQPYTSVDHSFYLRLLGGTRDKTPEKLEFWNSRLRETEAHRILRLGIVWGASGTGKSSFVEAGLIPLVSDYFDVNTIRADVKVIEDELMALAGLTVWSIDDLSAFFNQAGHKPWLVVIDQFESWLVKNQNVTRANRLIKFFQSVNGVHTKFILIARNEWSESLARFVNAVGIQTPHYESKIVEHLSISEAVSALHVLGIGYSRLSATISSDQEKFLDSAALALATNEQVQAMQLSVFAYLHRNKHWNVSIHESDVRMTAVQFLNQHCGSQSDDPTIVAHTSAVSSILWTLLPEDPEAKLKDSGKSIQQLAKPLPGIGVEGIKPILAALERLYLIRLIGGKNSRYQLTHDFWVSGIQAWYETLATNSVGLSSLVTLRRQKALWCRHKDNRHLLTPQEIIDVVLTVYPFRRKLDSFAEYSDLFWKSVRHHGPRIALVFFLASSSAIVLWKLWRDERVRRAEEWVRHAESVPVNELSTFLLASPPDDLVVDVASKLVLSSKETEHSFVTRFVASQKLPEICDTVVKDLSERPVKNAELLKFLPIKTTDQSDSQVRMVASVLVARNGEFDLIETFEKCETTDQRYQAAHLAVFCGLSDQVAIDALAETSDPGVAYFILLSISEFQKKAFLSEQRIQRILEIISGRETLANDPGVVAMVRVVSGKWIDSGIGIIRHGDTRLAVVTPGEFVELGSPISDSDRPRPDLKVREIDWEQQHTVDVDYQFAVGVQEVTLKDFLEFVEESEMFFEYENKFAPDDQFPVNRVSWHAAAAYCNWLTLKNGVLRQF